MRAEITRRWRRRDNTNIPDDVKIVLALLLTLSAAFARVGESDPEFRRRFEGPPDEVGKFENGAISYSFGSIHGLPRVKAFSVQGTISRVEYHGVSPTAARLILDAQAKDWTGYTGRQGERLVSKSGLKAAIISGGLIVSDGRYEALIRDSGENRPAASVVPL